MTKLKDLHQEWLRDPAYAKACDALEDEFALANAVFTARAAAKMTQADVAEAMGTTQTAVARLEAGRSMPSTRTLQRFAEATGTRLRTTFEAAGQTPALPPRRKAG